MRASGIQPAPEDVPYELVETVCHDKDFRTWGPSGEFRLLRRVLVRDPAGRGWNFEVGSGYYDESRFPGAKELACREVVRKWIDDRGIESPEEAELRLTAMGYDFDFLDDPRTVRSLTFGEDSSEPF